MKKMCSTGWRLRFSRWTLHEQEALLPQSHRPSQSVSVYWAGLRAPAASVWPHNPTYQVDVKAVVDCEAAISCSFGFWRAIQQKKASRISCFVHKHRFRAQLMNMQKVRCYQALSASCKLLGVDNCSACHPGHYSIRIFLQTFFSGVVWYEVIHNHMNSFII